MENMPIFALTTALLAILFLVLSANVVRLRLRYRVALGADGYEDLQRAIRAQGNFTEYVFMALFLLYVLTSMAVNALYLAALSLLLIIGRLFHAYGVLISEQKNPRAIRPRQFGFQCSVTTIGLSAITVIILLIMQL